jgi:tetratricopeptide (TPR) repeat protein
MSGNFLSRFTPSLMSHEALEAIFVQREELALHILERICKGALGEARDHMLIVGPRGMGKTHLVSLIHYRLHSMDELSDALRVAWLREEEWGVSSFLDLLLRILTALQADDRDPLNPKQLDPLYSLPTSAAEREAADLLRHWIGNRTLLIIMENLDDLFQGLGSDGLRAFRRFIDENPCLILLATSQGPIPGITTPGTPFNQFFQTSQLRQLSLGDATELLAKLAEYEGNTSLASMVDSPMGRARIRAVDYLAGGNPRVFIIFSQFLTRQSLDGLVEPLMRTIDDLTPYYQARMARFSPVERKVVEYLCDRRHAVPLAEVAHRCLIRPDAGEEVLSKLHGSGHVRIVSTDEESYYELQEPLMRLSVEVKKHRGKPVRLFVDFLRFWYTPAELKQNVALLPADAVVDQETMAAALDAGEEEYEDPRIAACYREHYQCLKRGEYIEALRIAEELIAMRGYKRDWFAKGHSLSSMGRHSDALACFDRIISIDSEDSMAWLIRGASLLKLGRNHEALVSCERACQLNPNNARAWGSLGAALSRANRAGEAVSACDRALGLDEEDMLAWFSRGVSLSDLGKYEDAWISFNRAVDLDPDNVQAWGNRAAIAIKLGRYREALQSCDEALRIDPENAWSWSVRGAALGFLDRNEESLHACDQALRRENKDTLAWGHRGKALVRLERFEEALESFEKMIELDPTDGPAWFSRGVVLGALGRFGPALKDCRRAVELEESSPQVLFKISEYQLAMGKWEQGIADLEQALGSASGSQAGETGDTAAILWHLLRKTSNPSTLRIRVAKILELYERYQAVTALGRGLVSSVDKLSALDDKQIKMWDTSWQELGRYSNELRLPLRLLNAAVRFIETQDMKIFLNLAQEERKLLLPLLGVDDFDARTA